MQADVAAIIPVHNGAQYIREALASVYAQTYLPREIIVIDDGSTDNTSEIVKSFPDVIYHYQHQAGAAEARNAGVERATTLFIAFLDADELWTPKKTEKQLQLIFQHCEVGIVSGRMQQFTSEQAGKIILSGTASDSQLLTALLLRREIFWRVGPLRSTWTIGETIEWWARAVDLNIGRVALPETVYLRRRHAKNLGRTTEHSRHEYLKMLHMTIKRRRNSNNEAE